MTANGTWVIAKMPRKADHAPTKPFWPGKASASWVAVMT
jgi:hypothetical protein